MLGQLNSCAPHILRRPARTQAAAHLSKFGETSQISMLEQGRANVDVELPLARGSRTVSAVVCLPSHCNRACNEQRPTSYEQVAPLLQNQRPDELVIQRAAQRWPRHVHVLGLLSRRCAIPTQGRAIFSCKQLCSGTKLLHLDTDFLRVSSSNQRANSLVGMRASSVSRG